MQFFVKYIALLLAMVDHFRLPASAATKVVEAGDRLVPVITWIENIIQRFPWNL